MIEVMSHLVVAASFLSAVMVAVFIALLLIAYTISMVANNIFKFAVPLLEVGNDIGKERNRILAKDVEGRVPPHHRCGWCGVPMNERDNDFCCGEHQAIASAKSK